VPLQLLAPPLLVAVRGPDGQVRKGVLLARRGERRFVQVSGGPGDNRLRWVPADVVLESQPAGASGDRIGCGVVELATS